MLEISTYQDKDSWAGGYYELAIELHPDGDTKRLINALEILCGLDEVNELYESELDYKVKATVVPNSIDEESSCRLYTTINLPDNTIIGAVIIILRIEGEADLISLSIPIGMLGRIYPIDYGTEFSINYKFNDWQKSFDEFLISIAEKLYILEPFNLGTIGWEVLAEINQSEITASEIETAKTPILIPSDLDKELQVERKSAELANGLRLYLPIEEDIN
ncbi:hypothetical protein [Gottfriedia solisilvae]|uniref:hypothetical protein n=1 Tax=Gottfriedia solisilvae TaxID=1516104 RepID=UPI003D2F27C3